MIFDKVRKTIEQYRMISRGDRVIVGVSGGMDSVALLSLLERLGQVYGISLVVAHLNHNLRGQESRRDASFVKKLALKLGLPCEIGTVNVRELKKKGMTLQEAAREARFIYFQRLLEKHRAQKIALGQTADDQAETMVMRFVRGSGLMGLKGIPPVRDNLIIHPLIEVKRIEIEAFLSREELPHVEDSSNWKDVYHRNRIRKHLLPALEGYNPNLKTILGRMGRVLLQEDQYMEGKAREAWTGVARQNGAVVSLDLTAFGNLHPALQFRLLRRSVESVSEVCVKRLGATHILSLADLATSRRPHSVIHLPGGIIARRVYDRLEIGKRVLPSISDFDYPLMVPGITPIQELEKKVVTGFLDQWDLREASSEIVFMDSQRLHSPFQVRNYQSGDRFRPLGMAGRKKIKDCFIDWKVPREERPRVPLILSGETVVWVVGYRVSQDVRVTGDTRRVVRMEFQGL